MANVKEAEILALVQQTFDLQPAGPEFRNATLIPLLSKLVQSVSVSQRMKDLISTALSEYLSTVAAKVAEIETPLQLLTEYAFQWQRFKAIKACFIVSLAALFKTSTSTISIAPSIPVTTAAQTTSLAITEFCYKHWRTALLEPIRKPIQEALHQLLKAYRDSILYDHTQGAVDTSIIRNTVNSYQELDPQLEEYYSREWETPFLNDTRAYYTQASASFLQTENVSSYLGFCDSVLDLEEIVASQFLNAITVPKHKDTVNIAVIISHQSVLQEALSGFVYANRSEDLRRIYRLFDRIQELDPLLEIFCSFAEQCFQRLFTEMQPQIGSTDKAVLAALPRTYCRTFLDKYYQFLDIINYAFNENLRFTQALERVGRRVMNSNAINAENDPNEYSARLAARFSDDLLTDAKLDLQELTEDRMCLQAVKLLFVLLASKDVFCKHYKTLFCNRLLRNKIHNRDAENNMIHLMRGTHDLQFSQQLTVMMRDVESSRQKYGLESGFLQDAAIPCDPIILTASSWPLNSHDLTITLNLPRELENLSQRFSTQFQKASEGKIVDWLHERSNALIEFRGKSKIYRITVNHFQVTALMAFLQKSPLSTEDLASMLELSADWLEATLKSLRTTRLIQQNPTTKVYRLNPGFEAEKVALDASLHFHRPVVENSIDPQIEEQRELNTQAAIVRIMKARRVLDHITLCEEVTRQTSRFFPQKVERIKRQIEKLINGQEQYLERVDNKTYKYVTGADN